MARVKPIADLEAGVGIPTEGVRRRPSELTLEEDSDSLAEDLFSSGQAGLVHTVSLNFLSTDVETLYLRHIGADRGRALVTDVASYLTLSFVAFSAFFADLWASEGDEERVAPAMVAAGTWAATCVLQLVALLMLRRGRDTTATIVLIAAGAGVLPLSVPVVLALLPRAAARQATTSLGVLLCVVCMPGALLTVPVRWAAPPTLLACAGFCAVRGAHTTLDGATLVGQVLACALVALLVLVSQRRHELLHRMTFYRAIEDDVRHHLPADLSLSRTGSLKRSPFRRSLSTKADGRTGEGRTATPSTHVEEALSQLRTLQRAPHTRSGSISAQLARTVELLEASIVGGAAPVGAGGSATFDWRHEVEAAGLDESVGEWLMSTLNAGAQDRLGDLSHESHERDVELARSLGHGTLCRCSSDLKEGDVSPARSTPGERRSSEEEIDASGALGGGGAAPIGGFGSGVLGRLLYGESRASSSPTPAAPKKRESSKLRERRLSDEPSGEHTDDASSTPGPSRNASTCAGMSGDGGSYGGSRKSSSPLGSRAHDEGRGGGSPLRDDARGGGSPLSRGGSPGPGTPTRRPSYEQRDGGERAQTRRPSSERESGTTSLERAVLERANTTPLVKRSQGSPSGSQHNTPQTGSRSPNGSFCQSGPTQAPTRQQLEAELTRIGVVGLPMAEAALTDWTFDVIALNTVRLAHTRPPILPHRHPCCLRCRHHLHQYTRIPPPMRPHSSPPCRCVVRHADCLVGLVLLILPRVQATEGHALYFLSLTILDHHGLVRACRIDRPTLSAFLLRIERK
jgi:hypothetical protein